jgi:hypothetical protein
MNARHCRILTLATAIAPLAAPAAVEAQDRSTGPLICQIELPDGVPEGTYEVNAWTDGIVPYLFHSNVTAENQLKALDSMAEIEAVSAVQFIPRTDEPNFIVLRDWPSNVASCIGMPATLCFVSILSWENKFIIAHELMHALGVWHEQQRPDRDQYVEVNFDHVPSGLEGNWTIQGLAHGPYDFESIMHYPRNLGGADNNWVIKVHEPYKRAWQRWLGGHLGAQPPLSGRRPSAEGFRAHIARRRCSGRGRLDADVLLDCFGDG